jgi:hypothetical protein
MNSESSNDSPLAQSGTIALVDLRSGRVYPLQPGPNSIGRSSKSCVFLDDPAISRRHAVLMIHDDGRCEIGDAGSRHGVRLHDRRICSVSPLAPGDVIQICDFWFLFARTKTEAAFSELVFKDDILGSVTWNCVDSCWHVVVGLEAGGFVPATYAPRDKKPPADTPDWDNVRACFRRIQSDEDAVRAFSLEQLDRFERLHLGRLSHILFTSQAATLIYGGDDEAICVTIDARGQIASGPSLVELGRGYDDE